MSVRLTLVLVDQFVRVYYLFKICNANTNVYTHAETIIPQAIDLIQLIQLC